MANQYVNRVDLADGTVLIDLSSDTVAADKMLSGYTAHGADGAPVTGTIPGKSASDVGMDGITLTAASGYYGSAVSKKLSSLTVPSDETLTISYSGRQTAESSFSTIYLSDNRNLVIQNNGEVMSSHNTQGKGDLIASAYGDSSSHTLISDGSWVTTNVQSAGTYYGKVVVPAIAPWMYPVGSLWATEDGTKNPATELGFGTWTKVSPIKPTWNRLKATTTWADMQVDAPTVYVWKRTA